MTIFYKYVSKNTEYNFIIYEYSIESHKTIMIIMTTYFGLQILFHAYGY